MRDSEGFTVLSDEEGAAIVGGGLLESYVKQIIGYVVRQFAQDTSQPTS